MNDRKYYLKVFDGIFVDSNLSVGTLFTCILCIFYIMFIHNTSENF